MNVTTIFNLQTRGEHPICGPNKKLEESGFTYDPLEFEKEGIHVYNYSWSNSDETTWQIMKIVQKMNERMTEGKMLLHCHSGTGRTGVVIACFLIFAEKDDISVAVTKVKNARHNTFESEHSIKIVEKFAVYLADLRNVFPEIPKTPAYFIENQNFLETSNENHLNLIPKLVVLILKEVLVVKEELNLSFDDFLAGFLLKKEWTFEMEKTYSHIKLDLGLWKWSSLENEKDIMVLSQLLRDWLEDSCVFLIDSDNVSVFNANLPFKTLHNEELMKDKRIVDDLLEEIKNIFDIFEYRYLLYLADFLTKIVKLDDDNFAKVTSFIKYLGMLSMNIDRQTLESGDIKLKKSTVHTLNRFCNLMLFLMQLTKETDGLVDSEFFERDTGAIDETYLVRKNTASNIKFDLEQKPLVIQDCDSTFIAKLTIYENEDEESKNKKNIFRVNSYLSRVFAADKRSMSVINNGVDREKSFSKQSNSAASDSELECSVQSEEKKGMFNIVEKLRLLRKMQNQPSPNENEFEEIKKNPNAPRRFSDASKFLQFGNLERFLLKRLKQSPQVKRRS